MIDNGFRPDDAHVADAGRIRFLRLEKTDGDERGRVDLTDGGSDPVDVADEVFIDHALPVGRDSEVVGMPIRGRDLARGAGERQSIAYEGGLIVHLVSEDRVRWCLQPYERCREITPKLGVSAYPALREKVDVDVVDLGPRHRVQKIFVSSLCRDEIMREDYDEPVCLRAP